MDQRYEIAPKVLAGIGGGYFGYWLGHLLGWSRDATWPFRVGGGIGAIVLSIGLALVGVFAWQLIVTPSGRRPQLGHEDRNHLPRRGSPTHGAAVRSAFTEVRVGPSGVTPTSDDSVRDWISAQIRRADLLFAQGRIEESFREYDRVSEVARDRLGRHHYCYGLCLNDHAVLLYSLGRFVEAEPLFRQAHGVYAKSLDPLDPVYANAKHNLADVLHALGEYKEAEELFREAIRIRRQALGNAHPGLAESLSNLAVLYNITGNSKQAEPLAREALAIWEAAGDRDGQTTGLNNLALVLDSLGDPAQAEVHWQRALKVSQNDSAALMNLGALCDWSGRHDEAEKYLLAAVSSDRATLGPDHPNLALSVDSLSGHYSWQGRYAEAEPLLIEGLEILRNHYGDDHLDVALAMFSLALLFAATDRVGQARALIEDAQPMLDRVIHRFLSFSSARVRLSNVTRLRAFTDLQISFVDRFFPASQEEATAALDIVLRRKGLAAEAAGAQREAVLRGRYPALRDPLTRLTNLRMRIAQTELSGPGPSGRRSHAGVLSEWNTERDRLEAELARQIPDAELHRRFADVTTVNVCDALAPGEVLIEFVRFDRYDFDAASYQPWAAHPRYVAFVVLARQPGQAQMVDLGDADLLDRRLADYRSILTAHVGTTPYPLEQHRSDRLESVGSEVRAAVFDPLLPLIAHTRRLILAPDGDLTRLPFEVLPNGTGRHLIDDFRFSYVSTGRDLLQLGCEGPSEPQQPIVAADPDFDLGVPPAAPSVELARVRNVTSNQLLAEQRSAVHFEPLTGTRIEGEQVAKLLGVDPWLGADVLETRLRESRSPRVLHLATHGFFLEARERDTRDDRRNPWPARVAGRSAGSRLFGQSLTNPLLRSGLAMAGINTWLANGSLPTEAEDGVLTAEDVTGLDLIDTELVVLSACESGLGQVHIGEGVFGLRRAFAIAGADTLIMSLWKVPDLATAILMRRLYESLGGGVPCDDSLRDAQRSLRGLTIAQIREEWLRTGRTEPLDFGDEIKQAQPQALTSQPDNHRPFAHPFFWGAFICQGNTLPLHR